jgi:hypothetical protein
VAQTNSDNVSVVHEKQANKEEALPLMSRRWEGGKRPSEHLLG